MNAPTLLVLVRHAESARNKAKRGSVFFSDASARQGIGGVPDHRIELTPDGHKQAEETGIALREQFGTFDHIYTSGYTRTDQTADGLLLAYTAKERRAMARSTDLFLRERDTGYAYDMTAAESEAAFPWLQDYWRTFGGFMARPPGGESLADVVMRVQMFLDLTARLHSGKKLLVVTHGRVIQSFRFKIERWSYDDAEIKLNQDPPVNCSATSYIQNARGELELKAYNEVFWASGSPRDGA